MSTSALNLDCLFVYSGSRAGKKTGLPIMPAGLLAMAGYLGKKGVRSAIINLPGAARGEFRLAELIRERRVKLVCIPVHWHQQAGTALLLAKKIKKENPGVKIAVGGFTASYFAAAILEKFRGIDFVIRGDAEVPLLELLRRLKRGGADFSAVKNLAWRVGNGAVLNPIGYFAGPAMLAGLDLTGLNYVLNRNATPYHGVCFEDGMFTYVHGRGCADNCSACGGGRDFQKNFNGRPRAAVKAPASVAADFAKLAARGITEIQLPLSPLPGDAYYVELFRRLLEIKLKPVLKVELCGLPSKNLLRWFSRALAPGSRITIFAGSGSEKVRRLNRGRFYTNEQLIAILRHAAGLGINIWTGFTSGLPFETRRDLLATAALMRRIKRLFNADRAGVYVFSLEPGSPLFENPGKYGITLRRRTLEDFLAQEGKYDMGYSTEHFPESEIVRNLKFLESVARE
ncbi:MAG: cobalamin-dependent protein [Elusimicrobiota bacterium]|nr:cobalamin-dependent protein [Elusimicrobiota bacterium]